ncbi:methyl-accepting chemotaxis protein [Pyxidicoccus fallax]|nr:methyl-accepting chemotaxis protein [Pyxidicoccus fallax]
MAAPLTRLALLGAALLLWLAPGPVAHAASVTDGSVPVLRDWRFRWGDAPRSETGVPAWAKESGATEDWRPTDALTEPAGRGAHSFLWLSIPVPEGDWSEPALFLGEVSIAFEVYANGQRIYASGKLNPGGREVSESMSFHLVPLPREVLGGRVLLRIQSSLSRIGVVGEARVGARHALLSSAIRKGQAPFVMGILLLVMAFVAGGAFALHWRRRMILGLCVFATSGGMILIGVSGMLTALWDAHTVGMRCIRMGLCFVVAGLAAFVADALLGERMRWFRQGSIGFSAISVLLAIITLASPELGQRLLVPFLLLCVVVLLACVGVAAVEARRGNPDARLFVLGLGGLVLSLFITMLSVLDLGLDVSVGNVTHWGYLALTVSLVAVVGRHSVQVVRTLETHTRELESRQQEVRQLAQRMGSGAGELATVVEQLRSSSDEQAAGVSRQAVSLQQAEQTVEEIRQSSQLTAQRASELSAAAESAEQVGREGSTALEQTLSNLEAIRAEVSEMARRILALEGRTREVAGIVDEVKNLADQSNMLAINAAIEAVRSGDSGKGFGVVAREMRGLADQSIQATNRIREVLDGVGKSMREAARFSEAGDERVRQSVDAVRLSGAQLQKLAAIIGETSASMRQITSAVSTQDTGTRQMADAIRELNAQMRVTLTAVQDTQGATRSVHSLAESMAGMAHQTLQAELGPRAR